MYGIDLVNDLCLTVYLRCSRRVCNRKDNLRCNRGQTISHRMDAQN